MVINKRQFPPLRTNETGNIKINYLPRYCICGGQLYTCPSYGNPDASVHDQAHCTKCDAWALLREYRVQTWEDVFMEQREEAIKNLNDKSFNELVELIEMFHSALETK